MTMLRLAAPLTALAFLATAAQAQTVIGPFTGTDSDGFETQTAGMFSPCVLGRMFNDQGDLCTPGNSGAHITGSWSFMCLIFPHGGTRFFGSAGGYAQYTFDTPVSRFGGYFGTNNGTDDGFAIFEAADGTITGPVDITAPADCTWTWNGWSEDTGSGFVRIEVHSNAFGGAFLDMDDMEADFGPGVGPGTAYCFCGPSGQWPTGICNNPGADDSGCGNSSGSGAILSATGSDSVSAGDLVLHGSNALPFQPGLFFQGDMQLGGGVGIVFGDGLRCAGNNVVRLETVTPDANGDLSTSVDVGATGGVTAGDTKEYQLWYRDPNPPSGSPCGSTFNLTNGYTIVWTM